MCSLPGRNFATLARRPGSAARSLSRCEAVSQPSGTVASHQQMTKPFRVAELLFSQLACSMDCVKI